MLRYSKICSEAVRTGRTLLTVLAALLFILLCASFTDRPLKCHILNTCRPCFSVNYSQQQAEASCSPHVAWPLCHVTQTDHLDTWEFVASQLLPSTRIIRGGGGGGEAAPIAIFLRPLWWDPESRSVARLGAWQPAIDSVLTAALQVSGGRPKRAAALLEIGSGLGVRSLLAARLGHRVVAIDADFQNAIRLSASVAANGFEPLVRVYWNSAGDHEIGRSSSVMEHCTFEGPIGNADQLLPQQRHPIARTAHLTQIVQANGRHLSGVSSLVVTLDADAGTGDITDATEFDALDGRFTVAMVMVIGGSWTDRQPTVMKALLDRGFAPYRVSEDALLHPMRLGNWSGSSTMGWAIDVVWIRDGSLAPLMRSLRNLGARAPM